MSGQIALPRTAGIPARPAGAPVPMNTLTFKEVMGIIRRRIWLILIVTILCTILGGGLWYFCRMYYPKYTSQAFIRCKMPNAPDLLKGQTTLVNERVIALETQSKAAQLMGESFITRVLQRLRVQETKWFQKRKDNAQELMEDFKDSFYASPRRDTDLIMLGFSAARPEEAQVILREVMDQFQQDMVSGAEGEFGDRLKTLNKGKDDLTNELTRLRNNQKDLARLISSTKGWEGGDIVVQQELQLLHQEKLRLQALLKEMEILQAQVQEQQQQYGVTNTVRLAVEQDPLVQGLRNRVVGLNEEMSRLLERLGEDHQEIREVKKRIEAVQAISAQREAELERQYSASEEQSILNQVQSLTQELNEINDKFAEVSTRYSDIQQRLTDYESGEEQIKLMVDRLETYENEINSTKATMTSPDRVRVEIASTPTEPLEMSFPRLEIFLPGGFILGLMLSAGLLFLLEFLDDSIKSPSDVMRYLNIPLLGIVPEYEDKDADEIPIAKVAAIHPQSVFSESFRQVRTNLSFSAPAEEMRSILITSSTADCGKTTTAVNLGITLSAEGKKVLLVDANFRRPALSRMFPAEGTPRGLSNLLVGQVQESEAIRSTGMEGLALVESGPTPPNPAELLNSVRMREFLNHQKKFYDHIIIDGPPMLVVTDAKILAGFTDGTLLVVHAEDTPRGVVQRMLRELRAGNVRILGVLLNAVRPRRGGYFQESYDRYYEYIGGEKGTILPGGKKGS